MLMVLLVLASALMAQAGDGVFTQTISWKVEPKLTCTISVDTTRANAQVLSDKGGRPVYNYPLMVDCNRSGVNSLDVHLLDENGFSITSWYSFFSGKKTMRGSVTVYGNDSRITDVRKFDLKITLP